jgi:hypothetical protein
MSAPKKASWAAEPITVGHVLGFTIVLVFCALAAAFLEVLQ